MCLTNPQLPGSLDLSRLVAALKAQAQGDTRNISLKPATGHGAAVGNSNITSPVATSPEGTDNDGRTRRKAADLNIHLLQITGNGTQRPVL